MHCAWPASTLVLWSNNSSKPWRYLSCISRTLSLSLSNKLKDEPQSKLETRCKVHGGAYACKASKVPRRHTSKRFCIAFCPALRCARIKTIAITKLRDAKNIQMVASHGSPHGTKCMHDSVSTTAILSTCKWYAFIIPNSTPNIALVCVNFA
jgi:hypothetical protein